MALNTPPTVDEDFPEADFGAGNFPASDEENSQDSSVAARRQEAQVSPFSSTSDWRVRLSLAPNSTYLYNANPAGILEPLKETKGVLFPYMPKIDVQYSASYSAYEPVHSNYKIHTYQGSAVESISVNGMFTAQDTTEANYLLAVIHFFRSITKMFYGADINPIRGTPPPLVYLSGLGAYQFDNHPMVVQSFVYSLPDDVDYINSGAVVGGINLQSYNRPMIGARNPTEIRLERAKLQPGGLSPLPVFTNANIGKEDITRVPTRIGLSVSCLPITTRYAMANEFSLKSYATGQLLRGSKNARTGGGIW